MTIKGEPVKVFNVRPDRCARQCDLVIGRKKVALPVIAPLAITKNDAEVVIDFIKAQPQESLHLQMLVTRLIDSDKTIAPILRLLTHARLGQRDLDGHRAYSDLDQLVRNTPIMIDPCTEYTWYEMYRKELATNPNVPLEIRKLAERIEAYADQAADGKISKTEFNEKQAEEYEKFWLGLLNDEKLLADIVTKMLDIQHGLSADIGLPPVPAVYSLELLEVTKRINHYARHIWSGENCAAYVMVTPEFGEDEDLIKALNTYLEEIENNIIVIKFKNLELHKVSYILQRRLYKSVMETILKIKKKSKDKVFVLLEAGYQIYPSIAGGFDIVSTSLRGYDKDMKGGRPENEGLGGWFDPKYLVFRSIRDVRLMLKSNSNSLKCSCPVCTSIKTINRKEWNTQRRYHYLFALSKIMTDLCSFIDSKRMELARSKLADSALSNFKTMLPLVSEE